LKDGGATLTAPIILGAGSVSAPSITTTGDTNTGIFFPAADTIAFGEGGAEAMRVDSNGRLGIGTTAPGSALDVKGTVRLSGATSGYVGLAPAAAAGSTTYTLPSADGTSGQFLSTNGSALLSWATALGIAYDRQVFNSSGTWTKPASGTICIVQIWGAGGGGASASNGRGAGGGGGYSCVAFPLSNLTGVSTVTITMGAGGTGTNNATGGTGGSTTFGTYITHVGGGGGTNTTFNCSNFIATGASGRLSATSGIDVIWAAQELSKAASYTQVNQTNTAVNFATNMLAPGHGATGSLGAGASALGGAGGTYSAGAGTAPGGGGGANSGNAAGGAGAIGRMVITVL
jgi:hypothetical protein